MVQSRWHFSPSCFFSPGAALPRTCAGVPARRTRSNKPLSGGRRGLGSCTQPDQTPSLQEPDCSNAGILQANNANNKAEQGSYAEADRIENRDSENPERTERPADLLGVNPAEFPSVVAPSSKRTRLGLRWLGQRLDTPISTVTYASASSNGELRVESQDAICVLAFFTPSDDRRRLRALPVT